MRYEEVIKKLKKKANRKNVEGMARFGIASTNTLGVSIYDLRPMAKEIGKNHRLALRLWKSGIHEAKILASYIDEPAKVTEGQMEDWAADFDSWDVCDQVCELFGKTPYAYKKIVDWSKRKEEFVKRAAFALIAEMAWHDKQKAISAYHKRVHRREKLRQKSRQLGLKKYWQKAAGTQKRSDKCG